MVKRVLRRKSRRTHCRTVQPRAPLLAPLPRQRSLVATAVQSGVALEMGVETREAKAEAEGAIVVGTLRLPHLDLPGTCLDPRGVWLTPGAQVRLVVVH
jgi:hypothetical protein